MAIARQTGASILSVDSMQVYRGMDIGTAKPTVAEREEVPHGMIDITDPALDFTVAEFQQLARQFLHGHDRVIIVGGSGMHFRSVVDPLEFPAHDPEIRAEVDVLEPAVAVERLLAIDPGVGLVVDLQNPRRVARALEIAMTSGDTPSQRQSSSAAEAVRSYQPLVEFVGIGVDPGDGLGSRIDRRVSEMLDVGLVAEVSGLMGRLGRNASQAVGYKQLLAHLAGECSIGEALENIGSATRALARRQRTYFRRDPRIRWLASDVDIDEAVTYCLDLWQ